MVDVWKKNILTKSAEKKKLILRNLNDDNKI